MSHVDPRREQFEALLSLPQDCGPVEMINLLRYRDRAEYRSGSGHAPCTGREAYLRYGAAVQAFLERVGGAVVTHAAPMLTFIGPADERWDDALVVRYPDVAAFARMIMDPGYQEIAVHRTAALADSRLLVTRVPPAPLLP